MAFATSHFSGLTIETASGMYADHVEPCRSGITNHYLEVWHADSCRRHT